MRLYKSFRHLFAFGFLRIIGCLMVIISCSSMAQKPNVIIVLTDDQGYGELSVHGNPVVKTPNLDQLHQESLRLTDFHVAPMCTPTRSQLLTGQDAFRNGASNVSAGRTMISRDVKIMPQYFKESGYQTGLFGKWHLGDNTGYRPQDRGFDEVYTFLSSYIGSLSDTWENDYFDGYYYRNGAKERSQGYTTDVFFNEAMTWMGEQVANEQPFFCFLPTAAPHWPHYAPDGYRKSVQERLSALKEEFPSMNKQQFQELSSYLSMIENIDDNMGRLDHFLRENGLYENTIIIFLSDNGSTFGHMYFPAGMRGHKSQLWEGGHRVPFFIRWPMGNLASSSDIEGLAQVQDLLPTLIDLCDLGSTNEAFDGANLTAALRGNEQISSDRMLVINYSRMSYFKNEKYTDGNPAIPQKNGAAVLWKDWRLIENRELYNLSNDPLQQQNVIHQHPKVAAKMRKHLDRWWKEVEQSALEFQPILLGDPRENPVHLSPSEWTNVSMDRQDLVRKGDKRTGAWQTEIKQSGRYLFELRRFPASSGLSLSDSVVSTQLSDGTLPGGPAWDVKTANLKVGEFAYKQTVSESTFSAVFEVDLKEDITSIEAFFSDPQGKVLGGAHYVNVYYLDEESREHKLLSLDGTSTYVVNQEDEYVSFGDEQVLKIPDQASSAISFTTADGKLLKPELLTTSQHKNSIIQTYKVNDVLMERIVQATENGFYISEQFLDQPDVELKRWESTFDITFDNDWNYASSVGGYIPDAYYKSPMVVAASMGTGISIIPDIEPLDLETLETSNHALAYHLTGDKRFISVGYIPAELLLHSVYQPSDTITWRPQVGMINAYYVLTGSSGEDLIDKSNRFLWSKFGSREQTIAAHQQQGARDGYRNNQTFEDWRQTAWHELSNGKWLEAKFRDGTTGGAVGQLRWGYGMKDEVKKELFGSTELPWSYSFTSWFNSMRTAYGMALYAKRNGYQNMLDSTARVLNILFNAPSKDGAFKCYAAHLEDGSLLWAAGDGKLFPTQNGYLGYDMAWTGTWMLRWYQAGLPNSTKIPDHCKALGDFYLKHQSKDGFIPTHYDEEAEPKLQLSRKLKAETAPVALFLFELYKVTNNKKYLQSALRALDFVRNEVIEPRQWYDYETFRSCAPMFPGPNGKPTRKAFDLADKASGLYPLNNLAMGQAVDAFLKAYRITNDKKYQEEGEDLLNYLLLYQQVWTNPLIKPYGKPGMLLGGFTTQNSDAEWSDARQAQFGNIILDYYRETGKVEYLQRGVAAIRAQFPINPVENFAHKGYPGPVYNTGFHWSVGSGMTAIEIESEFLGDVVMDMSGETVVGVNGINVTSVLFGKDKIRLALNTPFDLDEELILRIHGIESTKAVRKIYINDQQVGTSKDPEIRFSSDFVIRENKSN